MPVIHFVDPKDYNAIDADANAVEIDSISDLLNKIVFGAAVTKIESITVKTDSPGKTLYIPLESGKIDKESPIPITSGKADLMIRCDNGGNETDKKDYDDDGGLSGVAIVGIVIACVVVVAAIIALLVYFLVIKKKKEKTSSTQGDSSIAI